MAYLLSKSKYIRGLQCVKALWLDVHQPKLARYSYEQMRIFEFGRTFERVYKATFPKGIDISRELNRNVNAYPVRTAELLDGQESVDIFEAGFVYDDVLILADVVHQRSDGMLDIYEVKSGSFLSDTYRYDVALQYYVISHCRKVHRFSLVYRNSDITDWSDSVDADGLFIVVDLTDELQCRCDEVAQNITKMKELLRQNEPVTPIGEHCFEPYACPYHHYCVQGVKQMSMF